MKELFESAELEVILLSNDDIIKTSAAYNPISGGVSGLPEDGNDGDF